MKIRLIFSLLVILAVFSACQEGDGDKDYGFAYLYMPQATVSGGLDNYYPVPSGGGEYTYNFEVKDGRLNVILGVLRSGKLANEAYSVEVKGTATTSDILTKVGGLAMPATMYTLPQKVDVASGKSGETFFLSIDAAALKTAAYAGKKLVLTVGISNPTNYELAKTGTSVVVVVDVNSVVKYL